jgi:mRNA interferase RelE/StbE
MRSITYSKAAIRTLRRLPANVSRLIVGKIEQYAEDPISLAAQVKRLQGRAGYRLRVGDWRIIFDESDIVVGVVEIGPRGGIYEI